MRADVRLLLGVGPGVRPQVSRGHEALVAPRAPERPQPGVAAQMFGEVAAGAKLAAAETTREVLPAVRGQVDGEVVRDERVAVQTPTVLQVSGRGKMTFNSRECCLGRFKLLQLTCADEPCEY